MKVQRPGDPSSEGMRSALHASFFGLGPCPSPLSFSGKGGLPPGGSCACVEHGGGYMLMAMRVKRVGKDGDDCVKMQARPSLYETTCVDACE